jgi:hypothetical protein
VGARKLERVEMAEIERMRWHGSDEESEQVADIADL